MRYKLTCFIILTALGISCGYFFDGTLAKGKQERLLAEKDKFSSPSQDQELSSLRHILGLPPLRDVIAESLVQYATKYLGTPYVIAGRDGHGFDCSGFASYIFGSFGLRLPHQSALLASKGFAILPACFRKGDLIIFTGTNLNIRKPGHVGIVISEEGEPVRFIHASSNGGVKVSSLTDGLYAKRFLMGRRVLS